MSGPIPSPSVLQKYDELVPGLADRIVKMAENQSAHRIAIESKAINSDSFRATMGLVFGLIVALAAFAQGVWLISLGHVITGALVTGGTVGSLVGTFVYGSQQRRKERLDNQRLLQGVSEKAQ